MSTKKVPMRTCVACQTTRPKKELIRVVRQVDGSLMIDRRGKVSGRGAYLCPSLACVEQALKTRRLERALEVPLNPELIAELRQIEGAPA
ncbi:RNase P modulator RnpM [Sulfobacillus harzensis]|uniref:YlxR family protein n=1 Tax=Sulfobacillus harzensis TaxID=2729629 RepID=A0A7Y0Q1Z1_9FIRM|nr:YlxR family protein [Sulfobacillus harzensis]NMP21830.1 YlxR family protein [Sulfobacillus harzensis]